MIGSRLKKLRTQKSLTQKQIAKDLGVCRETYCQYERDKREPSVQMLIQLADLFHVSIDYLSGRTMDTEPCTQIDPNEQQLIQCYRSIDPRAQSALSQLAEYEAHLHHR